MYRTVVGSKGVSVPASRMAKNKTLAQQLAVGFALLPLTAVDATWLWNGLPVAGRRAGAVSGCDYLRAGRAAGRARPHGVRPHRRATIGAMRCDVLAVGTELLLGQINDTNSSWIGEQLALNGIGSLMQVKVGDNVGRIEPRCGALLDDADAVIVSGGLGPTHDDLTRDAIAAVMGGVELVHRRRGRRRDPRAVRHRAAGACRRTTCARRWCPSARPSSRRPAARRPG